MTRIDAALRHNLREMELGMRSIRGSASSGPRETAQIRRYSGGLSSVREELGIWREGKQAKINGKRG